MPKNKAPGGLFSSGRKVGVYPLDMLFFRNSGKRQADFSRTTNYFFDRRNMSNAHGTLVTIVGLSDLLGAVNQSLKDPAWLGLASEGYAFPAITFFICCFAMSAHGRSFERRLARGQGRAA
jgi:hypothetical protein